MKSFLNTTLALTGFAAALAMACGGGSSSRESRLVEAECRRGEITVFGEAPIYTSVGTAREKARTDACRRAVSTCIGSEVAQASGTMDAQSIGSEIFTQAQGICRNDEVVEEEQYNLDTIKMLRLFVRFTVDPSDISNRIDTMQNLVGNPKVMVLIREEWNLPSGRRVFGFSSSQGKAAPLVRDYLVSKGYTVLDPGQIARRIPNEDAVAQNPTLLAESIKDAAAEAGADVLIIGHIRTFPQQIATTGPFKSCEVQGNVQAIALWGDGRVLAEYTEREAGAQVSDEGAAANGVTWWTVGKDDRRPSGFAPWIHNRLSLEWGAMTRNNQIKMRIVGMDDVERGIFLDDLKEATNVRSIDEVSYSQQETVWDVRYPGRSFALADTIGFYGDNPNIFRALRENCKTIRVTRVKRGEIDLEFVGGGCGG
ncbi:MAG: hypothetical protein H7A21_12390 [Spirochaetales bacterium]|nr:hypothetical protein [Leptospiraceae bacterium]MCP5482227.1 hypothetical protein [Spirochaetales bacterium]MCP5484661.1 hypothetical protein [Spirochaetales bacterium]